MKNILRSGAVTAAVGVGLSLAVLPAMPANAVGGNHVRCNDIAALKAAIIQANGNANNQPIVLASNCTYTLTALDNPDDGLPQITGNVTISGHNTTIRRAPTATQDFRILHVVAGGRLTLNSLTVSGGRGAALSGGGIANESGRLDLNRSTIRNNSAFAGGGLFNTGGTLNLKHSTVERNTAADVGGGVFNTGDGTMTMNGGALLRNRTVNGNGGGIENIDAIVNLNYASVRGNTANAGGGIRQVLGSTLRLKSTTVSDNIAVTGAGISNNASTATLTRSLVTRNTAITSGGGIANEAAGVVTLIDSRVIRNRPDNCTPAGTISGCTNPMSPAAPPASPAPPAAPKARK